MSSACLWSPSYSHPCVETRRILLNTLASDTSPSPFPITFVLTSKRFSNWDLNHFSDEREPEDTKSFPCTMTLMPLVLCK